MNPAYDDILRRAEDLAERCERRAVVTATPFLTPAERFALERAFAHREPRPVFLGGADECERTCAFFLPDYIAPRISILASTSAASVFKAFSASRATGIISVPRSRSASRGSGSAIYA